MEKSRFYKIYGGLTETEKTEVCCEIYHEERKVMEPYSWAVAYMEINFKTKLSKKILEEIENYDRQTRIE